MRLSDLSRKLVIGLIVGLCLGLGMVGAHASTVTITGNTPDPTVVGQSYTISWSLAAGTPGDLEGNVTASDGAGASCTQPAAVGGASCSFSSTTAGNKTITVSYPGDETNAADSDTTAHDVNKADTTVIITSDAPDPTVVGETYTVSGTLTVNAPGSGNLNGLSVQITDGVGGSCTATVSAGVWSCALTSTSAGDKLITATFAGNANFNGSSATAPHAVNKASTTTAISSDNPDPSVIGEAYAVVGTVSVTSPGSGSLMGTSVKVDDGNGNSCIATVLDGAGNWTCALTSTSAGTKTITAAYLGNENFNGSQDTESHEVTKRTTTTIVMGSDTPLVVNDTATFTVTVIDTSAGASQMPTGNVSVSVVPIDEGTPVSWSHNLVVGDGGQFTFQYTPDSAATTPHVFTATYAGSNVHEESTSDPFDQGIIKRAVDIELICAPINAYIGQPISCQIIISDDTTAGSYVTPDETYLSLSDDRWVGPTRFSSVSWSTSGGSRVGTFIYTPAAWDTAASQASQSNALAQAIATITATYTGSPMHIDVATTQPLTINLRPTDTSVMCSMETVLVYQKLENNDWEGADSRCTVTVTDIAPQGTATSPGGAIALSTNVAGTSTADHATGPTGTSPESVWKFDYQCTALDRMGAFDLIQADYTANDGIHADSWSDFGQGVLRRPTITTITPDEDAFPPPPYVSTTTGVTCTATTEEDPSNAGTKVALTGNFEQIGLSNTTLCTAVGPSAMPSCVNFAVVSDAIFVNVVVQFVPIDRIHMTSMASGNFSRADRFDPGIAPGDATSCTAGCGTGGINVDEIVFGLNSADLMMSGISLVLEGASVVTDFLPDMIVGAGFGAITGATIPVSDIASAILAIPGIAMQTAILIMQTDLDGDGLQGVVEARIGTSDGSTDSDGDGMGDADEISAAGGFYGGSRRPSPMEKDSDGDGLMDGYEADVTQTDFCVADTDCDTIPDGVESASWLGVTDGFDSFAGYMGVVPTVAFDIKDQLDALSQDTDGDGLSDADEWLPGLDATITDGYANVSDSDGDGLIDFLDVYADVAAASGNDGELDDDGLSSIADFDSDGDGLSDGEEYHGGTDRYDWDSDDDGLSDFEELTIYFTDPNDPDSDDDTASGIIPFRPIGATLAGYAGDYADITLGSDGEEALSRTGVTPFEALGDQSDPLQKDTDGDGIGDELEFTPGCNCDGTGLDGYVNDDDSDNDGLQDGEEYALFGIGADIAESNGNDGELNDDLVCSLCDYDSDGDGLSDGEEVFTGTDPLDWDSDDDGLSDLEELQNYFTDPHMSDTDGDTAGVANPVIAERPPTFTDAAHPALTGHSGNGSIGCGSDCQEVYSGTLLFNPYYPLSVPAPGISGYGNPLDQTDPLQMDTDGDGINDDIEFNPGCNDGPGGPGTGTALFDGFANSFDSDADGLRDYEDAIADVFSASTITIDNTPVTRDWLTYFETPLPVPGTAKAASPDGLNDGELGDDIVSCMCDSDSDNDGVLDGAEHQIGTDPYDWDTDDDGRPDSEYLGNGPIASDPLDFDTDDDGLGDGVEVFGANPTNPVNADTDFDGLADGGSTTPASGGPGTLTGGMPVDGAGTNGLVFAGVAGHPNDNSNSSGTPIGYGEDVDGNGTQGGTETNPNDLDTDDDGIGDGVEVLSYTSSRAIPSTDMLGQTILVEYPQQVHTNTSTATAYSGSCGCLNPLLPDTDFDGLDDGIEDLNHDGNFDFNISDFDFQDLLDGAPQPDPEETNPCDPDTDHDGLTDYDERYQTNPSVFYPFNPTNPLDHDTDNDYLFDGEEVNWICVDPGFDLDPDMDGIDDFFVMTVLGDVLDPTNRDSDSDGFIDGLDPNPCYSWLIPIGKTLDDELTDEDGDEFSDADELAAGTDPSDSSDHPSSFIEDFDRDLDLDDQIWFEDFNADGQVDSIAIDLDEDYLVDARIRLILVRDIRVGDFDEDGEADDIQIVIEYAFSNGRYLHPRTILTITDLNYDFIIDEVLFVE